MERGNGVLESSRELEKRARCSTVTLNEQVSDAQMNRQNPNIESLVPPKRLTLFLIAAFCRLAKSLSHSEQMGWLVGAGGDRKQWRQEFQGLTRNDKKY